MEEKVLIKSEIYNIRKLLKIICILGIVASIIASLFYITGQCSYYKWKYKWDDIYGDVTEYVLKNVINDYFTEGIIVALIIILSSVILGLIIYKWLHSYELTVTDKRVFGKVGWGKRVDLPVDSVSAIATIRILKGIAVSTSSGRIKFLVIKNSNEIYDVLNNILVKRQQNISTTTQQNNTTASSVADELKKYKDLLDGGVITQDEFDKKKKQLLD